MAEKEGLLTDNAQYAILRFKKYKGPEIGRIEAHNERTKEKYDSNPDIDLSRSGNNFHIIEPTDRYRKMSEALIKQYACPRVRSDSVRVVETLITASPEFFEDKSEQEIRAFFQHAVDFLKNELGEDRLIAAPVQMPNITPHVCRHTYCSNQAKAGMNPKTLQYLMGHSDIGVTLNTYTHLGLEDAAEELRRMEEAEAARREQEKLAGKTKDAQKQFKAV